MTFSDEWKQAWKWLSVQLGVVCGVAGMLYGQVDFLQSMLPPKWYGALNGLLCLAMIYNSVRKK